MHPLRPLLVVLSFVAWVAPAPAQEAPDTLALARQYTMWLYAGEADSVSAHATEEARNGFATPDQVHRMSDMIMTRAGIEIEVVEETWKLRNGDCQYWRVARFSDLPEPLLIRWVLDPAGRIAGAGIGPLSQAPPVEQEHC